MADPVVSKKTVSIAVRRPTESASSVYVAGTFSDPKWELLEMSAMKPAELQNGAAGDDAAAAAAAAAIPVLFSRDFELPEGKYQYRFRDGLQGDWFYDDQVAYSMSFLASYISSFLYTWSCPMHIILLIALLADLLGYPHGYLSSSNTTSTSACI